MTGLLRETRLADWLSRNANAVSVGCTTAVASIAAFFGVHEAFVVVGAVVSVILGIVFLYFGYKISQHLMAARRGKTRHGSLADALRVVRSLQATEHLREEVLVRDVDDILAFDLEGTDGKKLEKLVLGVGRQRGQSGEPAVLSATALARTLVPDPKSGGRHLDMGKAKYQIVAARELAEAHMLHDAVAMLQAVKPNETFYKQALARVGTHKQLKDFREANPGQSTSEMQVRQASLALDAGMDLEEEVEPYLVEGDLSVELRLAQLDLIRQIYILKNVQSPDEQQHGDPLEELNALGKVSEGKVEPLAEWDEAVQAKWWQLRGDLLTGIGDDFASVRSSYQRAIALDTDAASPTLRLSHARALLDGRDFAMVLRERLQASPLPRLQDAQLIGQRCREAFQQEKARSRPRAEVLAGACVGMALTPNVGESAQMWLNKACRYAPTNNEIRQTLLTVLPQGATAHVLYNHVRK